MPFKKKLLSLLALVSIQIAKFRNIALNLKKRRVMRFGECKHKITLANSTIRFLESEVEQWRDAPPFLYNYQSCPTCVLQGGERGGLHWDSNMVHYDDTQMLDVSHTFLFCCLFKCLLQIQEFRCWGHNSSSRKSSRNNDKCLNIDSRSRHVHWLY